MWSPFVTMTVWIKVLKFYYSRYTKARVQRHSGSGKERRPCGNTVHLWSGLAASGDHTPLEDASVCEEQQWVYTVV